MRSALLPLGEYGQSGKTRTCNPRHPRAAVYQLTLRSDLPIPEPLWLRVEFSTQAVIQQTILFAFQQNQQLQLLPLHTTTQWLAYLNVVL